MRTNAKIRPSQDSILGKILFSFAINIVYKKNSPFSTWRAVYCPGEPVIVQVRKKTGSALM